MAYEPRMASALSGATIGQLAYWRNGQDQLLVPEISAQRPILYSFRDLIALRTFVFLRNARTLQTIRSALTNLREIGKVEHLSKYTLKAQGERSIVLVQEDGDGAVDLVENPGHQVTVIELGSIIRSFPLGDIEVPNLEAPRQRISVIPDVRRGHPVVKGTRVSYELVAGLVRDGVPPGEVKEFYPGVSADSARDATSFAEYVDRMEKRQAS
ncbi:DUF433 domain-containing protein [Salinispora arenicola]|uniref:DUF433 domain-containing protein n=1 Tax=Salinispora arenicola TaxID=168697 RepID=UPI001431488F|nr:DUF433 domain-containing protein [Salinispora arenicola]NIL40492.1 DUF433 domain-containing protein [Salinispora arenicola]